MHSYDELILMFVSVAARDARDLSVDGIIQEFHSCQLGDRRSPFVWLAEVFLENLHESVQTFLRVHVPARTTVQPDVRTTREALDSHDAPHAIVERLRWYEGKKCRRADTPVVPEAREGHEGTVLETEKADEGCGNFWSHAFCEGCFHWFDAGLFQLAHHDGVGFWSGYTRKVLHESSLSRAAKCRHSVIV